MEQTLHQFIKRLELFKGFTADELNEILRLLNRVRFKKDMLICREGVEGHFMYIIREGTIRAERLSKSGQKFALARMSEGSVIGEMAIVDNEARSASLVAETDGVLYEIRRENFEGLKDENSPAAYKMLRAIALNSCERLRKVNEQVEHYLDHPDKLLNPEIETGVRTGTSEIANKFFKLFGKGN